MILLPQKYSTNSGLATSSGEMPRRLSALGEWPTRVGFLTGVGAILEKHAP